MKDKHFSRCTPYTTKTGLQIGIAYTPPAQQLTYEGEEIQSILLGSRTPVMERRGLMVYAAIVAVVFAVIAVVVNK
jgi:hypothetical protein